MLYWIGLGSNLGNKLENLQQARQALSNLGKVKRFSPVFKTKPWGKHNQPDFFNAVLELESPLSAFRLLRKLKQIELRLGRKRSAHWDARTIDLDILEWQGPVIESEILKIPHPFMDKRAFVLIPLAHLNKHFYNRKGLKINEILLTLNHQEQMCELWVENW